MARGGAAVTGKWNTQTRQDRAQSAGLGTCEVDTDDPLAHAS